MGLSSFSRLWLKAVIFFLCLVPFLLLVYRASNDQLGANPIETLHFRTGDWALRFLCLVLALTPMKTVTGWYWPLRFRRMLGLFAFFYASLHLLVYVVLDQSLSWDMIVEDVPKSPYILVGLLTYLMMLPLAVTSTRKMQRRLGKNWKKLHRMVYLIAPLAVLHFFWLVKLDYTEPIKYGVIVLMLLLIRFVDQANKVASRKAVVICKD